MTALFELAPPPMSTSTRVPKVLGIDLSLTGTGVAGDGWADTITFPAHKRRDDRTDYRHRRLTHILTTLADYLHNVDLAVVEGLAFDSHDTDRQNAGLSWMVRHALWKRRVPYALVPPANLKQYAVGKGGGPEADKTAITAAVRNWHPWFDGDDNAADAAVLYAIGRDQLGHPIVNLPKTNRAALDAVAWPEVPSA